MQVVLNELNANGMKVDVKGLTKLLDGQKQQLLQVEQEITSFLGDTVEFADKAQIFKGLYRINVNLESLAPDYLKASQHLHPVVPLLLKRSRIIQFVRSYEENFLTKLDANHRIYGTWVDDGAITGRMAVKNPNLQSIDSRVKPYLIPEQGNIFVISDLKTIEVRILAELAREYNLIHAFNLGIDCHAYTVSMLIGKPIDKISNLERDIGKKCMMALCYGVTPYGLAKILKKQLKLIVSEAQCSQIISEFYRRYPAIKRYHNQLLTANTIFSLGGRSWSSLPKGDRKRLNLPIQATGAEGFKNALKLIVDRLPQGAKLVNAIHDEVVIECSVTLGQQVLKITEQCLKEGMGQVLKHIPVEVTQVIKNNFSK